MCLSIPARIISIKGNMADVSAGGAVFKAGLHMIEDVEVGDYILLHTGFEPVDLLHAILMLIRYSLLI